MVFAFYALLQSFPAFKTLGVQRETWYCDLIRGVISTQKIILLWPHWAQWGGSSLTMKDWSWGEDKVCNTSLGKLKQKAKKKKTCFQSLTFIFIVKVWIAMSVLSKYYWILSPVHLPATPWSTMMLPEASAPRRIMTGTCAIIKQIK